MKITVDQDQADWGSSLEYPDDPNFKPRYVVVHWGGGTAQIEADSEDDRLRIWQSYHLSKGWADIAYNYGFGDSGSLYRCRGLNPGGHTSGANDRTPEGDSYNNASVGIVWIGGASDEDGISDAGYAALAHFILEILEQDPTIVVKGHRTVKEEGDSYTSCPGDEMLEWIAFKSWEEYRMPEAEKKTTNPAFQDAWDEARESGMFSQYTNPTDIVTAEKLAVFLERVGFFKLIAWFKAVGSQGGS